MLVTKQLIGPIDFHSMKNKYYVSQCGPDTVWFEHLNTGNARLFKIIHDSYIFFFCQPRDLELEPTVTEVSHLKRAPRLNAADAAHQIRESGNDSASTAPRSTEASLSEDVLQSQNFLQSVMMPSRHLLMSCSR